MNWRAVGLPSLVAVVLAGVACDDDPTRIDPDFALVACPAGALNVNAPITLGFTQAVLPSTVQGGNVVVTDVETGIEVPGSVELNETGDGRQITFVPADPLPFQRNLRIRVQNLLTAAGNVPIGVTVCEVTTQLPPITELFWQRVPTATGNRLLGASQYEPNRGYVASAGGPIFRRSTGDFVVALHDPHFSSAQDVSFVSADHGFSTHIDIRAGQFRIVETEDAGASFITILGTPFSINRIWFDSIVGSPNIFGVAGGGTAVNASFFKYEPTTPGFTREDHPGTANVQDIDFRTGLAEGVAVSAGVTLPFVTNVGMLFVTSDSGRSWSMVAGSEADPDTRFYRGVGERDNGEVFVTGGNGTVVRFDPAGGGAYTRVAVTVDASLTTIDPTDPSALSFTDVQFSPDDDLLGWVIGQQLIGVERGVPQFRGLIYVTRDGGRTWIRQGVQGAEELGASFAALHRIDAISSTAVWIVGDGGIVLTYVPQLP